MLGSKNYTHEELDHAKTAVGATGGANEPLARVSASQGPVVVGVSDGT